MKTILLFSTKTFLIGFLIIVLFSNCTDSVEDFKREIDFKRIGTQAIISDCTFGNPRLDTFLLDANKLLWELDSNGMYCSCDSLSRLNFSLWFSNNGEIINDTSFNNEPFLTNFDTINSYTCLNTTLAQRTNKTKALVSNLNYFGAISGANKLLIFQFLDSLTLSPDNIDYCYFFDNVQGDSLEQFIVRLPILLVREGAKVIIDSEVFGGGNNNVTPILNHLLGGCAGAWAGAMVAIWDAVEEHGESGLYREDTRLGKKMAQGFFTGFVTSI